MSLQEGIGMLCKALREYKNDLEGTLQPKVLQVGRCVSVSTAAQDAGDDAGMEGWNR